MGHQGAPAKSKDAPAPPSCPLWLTEKQAAARLNMSQKWLQKCRVSGEGPPYAKFGSSVRYALSELEEYERACVRRSTSDTCVRDLGK